MKKIQQIENAVKKYRNLVENTEQFLWTHPDANPTTKAVHASGIQHGDNYYITDLEKACINPIKVLVLLVNHLLEKEASCANRIIDEYRPVFPGKEAYFQTIDGLKKEWTAVAYHEDGNIGAENLKITFFQ